jgi:hypothetical protein
LREWNKSWITAFQKDRKGEGKKGRREGGGKEERKKENKEIQL